MTGDYFENNVSRKENDVSQENQRIRRKYNQTHIYDKVYGRYYDPKEQ